MFLSRSVDEKPLYDRILLMLFSSTFAIEESELRILFCQWSNINFMFRCLGIKLPPWRTLETNSNTIIKLLEDEKRLSWKFNGPGLCCWARPSPSLPTGISSLSPLQSETQNITQKWDSSHQTQVWAEDWGPPAARVARRQLQRWEK